MTARFASAPLFMLVALVSTTCSENRPSPSAELDAVLATPGLDLGWKTGAPSLLRFDEAAARYVYGEPATRPPPPGPHARVGTGTQLQLGAATSAVSVTEPGSTAGVTLRPLDGPGGFASWGPGVASGSAVVYASRDGRSAVVERASPTGLKEDIVLGRSLGDSLRFSWELELGEGLEARLEADGSVGVYGVASVLGGDIQVSDDKSRVLLQTARRAASKTELRFQIPAPTVRVATGAVAAGRAHLELGESNGARVTLTLVATGLEALDYPLSIDPSVVVTSAADFALGNLEAGVEVDPSGRLKRAKTQFGVGPFAPTSSFTGARSGHSSVVFNGYLYVIGGHSGAGVLGDVQVAPLNADGTLGPFSTAGTLSAPRSDHTSVAWNGSLYVIGGNNGSYLNSVEAAPINSNGTLGAFTATTSFPTARAEHTSVAWRGFLYVIGGRNAGGYLADVQVAPLGSNGSVGAFAAATSFPTARSHHASVAYNDYLYVIGGSDGVVNYNTVHAAPINQNGTLGAFSSVGSFTSGRNGHASVASNGYLYVLGGSNGSALTDVQAAPLHANGTLGPFRASNPFGGARYFHSSVVHHGHLYVIGGRAGATFSDVQVAPINATGTVGGFAATSSFLAPARFGHASLAYNGYLYVSGGTDTGGPPNLADVQVATINPGGTLGPFTQTAAFTGLERAGHSSVAFNGFFYLIGGTLGGAAKRDDIQVATINPDGTLQAFAPSARTLPTARARHTSVVYNDYLYVIGGETASFLLDEVWVARLNADGTIGPFVATTPLPSARVGHTSLAYDGFLYVLGGGASNGTANSNDVQVAPINAADGTLGAFVATTPFPTARSGHTSVVSNGYLAVIGGTSDGTTNLNDVQVAPINLNGTVGAFTATPTLLTARRRHSSVVSNGSLFVLGGTVDGATNNLSDVQVAPLHSNGAVGPFTPTTSFAVQRQGHSSVAWNGYLYVLGGIPNYLTNDQVAPINADGTLGPFVATTPLPSGRYHHASVAWKGRLYVTGGRAISATLGDVQVAPFNPDGTLGGFTATTPLPGIRRGHSVVVHNGFLYVIGGQGGAGWLNDVQFAPINPDGTLGAFTATSTFTTARSNHTSVAYNGYLYVIGGNVLTTLFSDVQVAPINANGTLGPFVATTGLPGRRFAHATVAENGFLYVLGGEAASLFNDVLAAPINADGTLGTFQTSGAFSVPRSGHAAARWNGRVYLSGGTDVSGGGGNRTDVQVATLGTPAARGEYSRLIDFGAAAFTATSITVNGNPTPKGEVRLAYRVAPASGLFGPTLSPGPIALGATVPLGGGSGMRYLWVHLTLDDTLAATINPDATNERDVTDVTVVYSPDPVFTPASASLPPRGSQTFVCSGGAGGYTLVLAPNNSGGSVNGSGVYVAGPTGSVIDTITCTDSVLASVAANVTVTARVTSSPPSLSIPPRGAQAFTALGGSGAGYAWSFVTSPSGGTLSPAGAYQAGNAGSVVDTLRVTDSLLNTADVTVTVTAPLSINPATVSQPPRGTQGFTTSGGSGTGLVWSTLTNNSGMTLDPASGLYTAGTVGGVTDVIGVTDSLGNTASRSITVTAGVSLGPASATVAPRAPQTFVPAGGSATGFTWSFSSNASGGTLVGGLYTAGATGSVTDVVQVTDSLGNVAVANVGVTAGVSATPPSTSVTPRGTATFSASGGSGTGFTWSLPTTLSGGTVTPTGGYTAGSTGSVTDVLRVVDSLGNFVDVNVTVTAGIVIAPASPSTPPSGTLSFSATNGSGSGYTWALTSVGSSGATITAGGAYAAGTQQGTDVVRVTDSLGNVASVNVTVTNALAITPNTVSLAPRASLTFTGSGGSGTGFTWTMPTNNSGATFNPTTAAYQAGAQGGVSDSLRLTDSLGNLATATVNVTAGVTVAPATSAVPPKAPLSFSAMGGSGTGFAWSFQTNASGGTLDPATGAYLAGLTGSVTDVVKATDSLGNTGTAAVTVGPAVSVAPVALSIPPRGTQTFAATGGSNSSFTWSFVTNASMGSVVPGTGSYTAGRLGAVTDVLQVADSLGNVARFDVTVTAAVSITPPAPSLPPRGTILLMAAGGSGAGYSWFFTANRSGATLSPTNGLYQSGALSNVVDDVQVVDSLGNTATASISVTDQLAITPQRPTVAPRQALTLQAMGGAGGNRWTLQTNSSGASIGLSTGAYVAGPAGNSVDTVQVTDQNGNVATTEVSVTAGLNLTPMTISLPPRGLQAFAAGGGLDGGYTFSLTGNASGGSIDPLTGAYQAGPTGSVTDTVSVSDSLVTATATVIVTEAITITPATAELAAGASQTFAAAGGSGTGFTWALTTNGSGASLDPASGAYLAGATGNTADAVQVTDSLGNVATARITVVGGGGSKIPPAARPPANGWSCGCSSSGGPELLLLALGALFLRRRRGWPAARRLRPGVGLGAAVAFSLVLAPFEASAAPKKKAPAKVTAPPPVVAPVPAPAPVVEAPQQVVPPPAPRPKGKPSVAVLDVEVTVPGEKLDGAAFSEMVLTAVDSAKTFKVISSKEISTMLGIERQRQLLGCSDEASTCMTEIANALGSDFLMVASVGRVGENYLVSTRLINGSTNKVTARASVQARSANSLLEAVWRATQQTLDGYGASLPGDEAQQWAARPKPTPPATLIAVEETPSRFGISAAAAFGYQPLSTAGNRGSVGAQVDLTFRRGRLDLAAGVVIAPSPGARVTATWALTDTRARLDVGLRGSLFPGLGLYGGGVTSGFEFGLHHNFALNARVAVEAYPVQGTVVLALLGAAGVAARF